jgi:carbonic anhydrase
MTILSEILDHNSAFVRSGEYEAFRTDQFPNKKLVILTCMDTRLVELLPHAMGVRNGDVKMIKNAGAIVSHPFGSVMRSILVAVYELGAAEVAVVGHYGCGMTGLSCAKVLEKVRQRVRDPNVIDTLGHAGIDLQRWLVGFDHVEDGVRKSVEVIKHHPLLPCDVPVHGLIIHPETGKLDKLVDGYEAQRLAAEAVSQA